jgi:hypothetical protein
MEQVKNKTGLTFNLLHAYNNLIKNLSILNSN